MKSNEKNMQLHMRVILLLVGDVIAIMLSSFLALWLRFELVFSDIDRVFWNLYGNMAELILSAR